MQRSHLSSRLAAVAALTVGLATGVASAGESLPTYHVTRLADMIEEAFPGVTFPSSDPRGLNEDGDLVGEAWLNGSQMQGFVYTYEHGITPLPLLPIAGWASAAVRDVSDRDENGEIIIVGGSTYGVHTDIAVGVAGMWRFSTVTGEVLETRVIGIPPGHDESIAIAVSNDGTVVGYTSPWESYINWKYDIATDTLETFDFPWRVADMNNKGQVCGGSYRGDLFGNYEEISDLAGTGVEMPDWAIENGGISAGWAAINDQGWMTGRAGTGMSDGAGHFLVAIVRFADPLGWHGMNPVSHLSLAGDINDQGDFVDYHGGLFLESTRQQHSITLLLAPEFFQIVSVYRTFEINNHQQIAAIENHAMLLTPLGVMVIPGDVNGDIEVNLDDHCAWVENPIDLDGDGDADDDDEQWLFDRLAFFGYSVEDCNGNGFGDRCDILSGFSFDCDGNDVADECQPDCSGDGVPDVCEPDCNGNGNPDPCDIGQGVSEDCNGNGIPDECDGGGTTDVQQIFDPPVELFADNTFTYDIAVTDTGIVDDVDFNFDIHYRIGDLSVMLSHNGTTITLIDRPGHPESFSGNGQLGYDIILDDEGTGGAIENQGNFGSPFTQITSPPSYTPDDPLSTFDGMPMEGTWTVHVVIRDFHPAHTFDDWGLTITRAAVPVDPDNCVGGPGDVNGDGLVNVLDLLAMLSAWGSTGSNPADLNNDGTVDILDLLELLAHWG